MRRPFPIAPMASCFALTGFAVAMVASLTSGAGAVKAIEGALFALIICYLVGLFAGRACIAITREHLKRVTDDTPVGTSDAEPGTFVPTAPSAGPALEAEAA